MFSVGVVGREKSEGESRQVSCTVVTITLSVPSDKSLTVPLLLVPQANIHAPNWRPPERAPPSGAGPPLCPR